MSDFLEVPRRDKWQKRCQRKFRRRRYRTWTCYRPPLRKTNGGASRRSERERERERERIQNDQCFLLCERNERDYRLIYRERERERECVLYGATGISLSLSLSLLQLIQFFFYLFSSSAFVFLPTCVKLLLFPCFLFFWEELLFVYFCFLISFYPIIK